MTAAWPFEIDQTQDWTYWDAAFTPAECQQIIAAGESKPRDQAQVRQHLGTSARDNAVRDSSIAWLHPEDGTDWAYRRITDMVMSLNQRYFGFDLWGLAEGLQFTRYDAPAGHYGRHADRVTGGPVRKLSLTIQLSDPADYDGGELALYMAEEPTIMQRSQGHMVVFPSYVLHEVRPVTRGTRYSLVAWVTGKPLR